MLVFHSVINSVEAGHFWQIHLSVTTDPSLVRVLRSRRLQVLHEACILHYAG